MLLKKRELSGRKCLGITAREDENKIKGAEVGSYLDVIRCQVSLHVTVLLFGWGRGRFVGGWEVGPVKKVKR